MSAWGLAFGIGLVGLVTFVAVALARRANESVARFRDEQHEPFMGADDS